MVHALEKALSYLHPGGVILEVHDLIEPPRIEVHSDDGQLFAGQLFSKTNFEYERMANQAINRVVAEGTLKSDRSTVFESYIRADSYASLAQWLADKWPNEYIPEETQRKVHHLESRAAEKSEVVLKMVSRLNQLNKT